MIPSPIPGALSTFSQYNIKEADRQYWKPLRAELEAWRLRKTRQQVFKE